MTNTIVSVCRKQMADNLSDSERQFDHDYRGTVTLFGYFDGETSIPMTEQHRVSPDARYLAAWNEISARIAQRQALITIYTSLAFPALGAPAHLGGRCHGSE